MSVINDMLAQLDKRSAPPMMVGQAVVAAPASAGSRRTRWRWLALLATGAVTLAAAAWSDWPAQQLINRGGTAPDPFRWGPATKCR